MKHWAIWGMLIVALALGRPATAEPVPTLDEEFRGIWVTRFSWPQDTEEATREYIRNLMSTLAENNFNAVLFQIRGQMDVAYPSPYEPWSAQFNWTDPGWDPVAYAIEQAHEHGLEFHAYINTHTLRRETPPETTEPQHRFNVHGPDSDDTWVIHNENGEVVAHTDGYVWLSPGHPDAEAWTRRAIDHVVSTYDVDGIHFDRIRTPSGDFSHDPKTVARFQGDGNPDDLEWGDFMRAQITNQLRRIYGATNLRNPSVKVSAAPFGIAMRVPGGYQGTGTQSHYSWKQDSFGWMQQGVVDILVPMIYWDIASAHPFEVLLKDFLHHRGDRHVVSGMTTGRDYIEQIYESRRQNAHGHVIFTWPRADMERYREGPYQTRVPVPGMPWKDTPTSAIVAGTVTDSEGNPLLDSWVWIRGASKTFLTGADGFYSVLNLKPGYHTITVRKNGVGEITRTVELAAGDVQRLDITLPATFSSLEETADTMRLVEQLVTLAGTEATRLRPEYIREALEDRANHERIAREFARVLAQGTENARERLIRAIELKFIHDPETSTLDLLEPDQATLYRTFDWDPADYPGGPEGPNEEMAREMVRALIGVRPERRANTGHDPVVVRAEASEEVWQYMEDEWTAIPGEDRYQLNRFAVESYLKMREQAKKEGVELVVRSAHRSRQRAEANAARTANPYAVASFSSHSLGLAIDFQMSQGDLRFSEITTRPMSEVIRMRESPVHKWMFLRGDEFGWFPYMHEPWHWEYNPEGFRAIYWSNFPGGAPELPEPTEPYTGTGG